MKFIKRHIKLFIGLISFLIVLTVGLILINTIHLFYPYETFLNYEYDSDIDDKLEDLQESCEILVQEGNNYDEFKANMDEIDKIYNEYNTYYKIEYINECKKYLKGNEYYLQKFLEKTYNLDIWLGEMYEKISKSNFKDRYFLGKSSKEINCMINKKTEFALSLDSKIAKLINEYIDLEDEQKYEKFANYYYRIINLQNEYAKALGYDNFYEYGNEYLYKRDYGYDEEIDFASKINNYFIKDFTKRDGIIYDAYYKLRQRKARYITEDAYQIFENKNGLYNYNYYSVISSDYANWVGGDYKAKYDEFKESGYLVTSNEEDCYKGAFTSYLPHYEKPVMFLGTNDYQSLFVYNHEFGHYYNFLLAKDYSTSLDLCETQSQGNELLLLSYMTLRGDYFSNSDIDYILSEKCVDFINTLINGSLVGLVELEAYNMDGVLTEERINNIISNTANKYFPELFSVFNQNGLSEYVMDVIINHPMYYFSYATSIMASFNLFYVTIEDHFNGDYNKNAIDKYYQIQNNYELGFLQALESAGIDSPFDDKSFENLDYIINRI